MTLPESFVKNVKLFQAKNNLPVHLKGGPLDVVLYRLTLAGCGIGLVCIAHMIWDMGFRKKTPS